MKNNVWTKFQVKKELTEIVKRCIRKILNNEILSDKEIELLRKISK